MSLPALEMLLARGRRAAAEPKPTERWLIDTFCDPDTAMAAGALTLLADGGAPSDACWMRADPVHLRIAHDRIRLIPGIGLGISHDEAQQLCVALNAHFDGALTFSALDPERWCVRLPAPAALDLLPTLDVAPNEISARDLRDSLDDERHAQMNELQMLLHAHPVNAARERAGLPVLNSVWIWGAGALPREAKRRWHTVCANEPVARGLAKLSGAAHHALPHNAQEWLERAPAEGRHLVVHDGLRNAYALGDSDAFAVRLRELESNWFSPLLAALRSGRVGMISTHTIDASAAYSFEITRGDLRRFWRRPRSIAHYA